MSVISRVFVFVLVFSLLGFQASSVVEWPTFKGGMDRTGFTVTEAGYPLKELSLVWSFKAGKEVRSSPAVADLDGDGKLEIVFGSDDGVLYILDYQGKTVKTIDVGSRIRSSPTISDLGGDDVPEILFGADNKVLYALDSSGMHLWNFTLNGSIRTSPLVANFDGTPQKEIIVSSEDGFVYAFDYLGRLKWSYRTAEAVRSSPAAGDVNGDGKLEIAFGSNDNLLYLISFPPYKIWQYQTNGDVAVTPVVSDYDGDGKMEVIFSSTDKMLRPVYFTHATSSSNNTVCKVVGWEYVCTTPTIGFSKFLEEWNYSMGSSSHSSPSIADFTGKSKKEIVFGTDGHSVFIVNHEGMRVGGYTTNKAIKTSPALADLDGDDIPEIIFGSDDGGVYVLDYPYLFSLSTSSNKKTTSKDVYESLIDRGDKYLDIAEKIGENATILTVSATEWKIQRVTPQKTQELGRIKLTPGMKKLEFQVGSFEATIDARKSGSNVNAYDYPNRKRFQYMTSGPVRSSPAVADLEGDGYPEIVIGSDDGKLYVFGSLNEGVRTEALRILALAENAYESGKIVKAESYVREAVILYESIDDSDGISEANKFLKRLEADSILEEALRYYNESEVGNATDFLERAQLIYSSINYTKYTDDTRRLSDLLEAERYYREADYLYDSGDLDNASVYALKAVELFTAYNDSIGGVKSKKLFETALEHGDADYYYVSALNLFFDIGYHENVTEMLMKAKVMYEDVNALESILVAESALRRVNATKLCDDAYVAYESGDIRSAYELALSSSMLFASINYSSGLYRAERLLNDTSGFINAGKFLDHAISLYSSGNHASAIDYALKSRDNYYLFNDSRGASRAENFADKVRVEYMREVKRPTLLVVIFNVLVGIFAGLMFILSAEKLIEDRRKAKREKQGEESFRADDYSKLGKPPDSF